MGHFHVRFLFQSLIWARVPDILWVSTLSILCMCSSTCMSRSEDRSLPQLPRDMHLECRYSPPRAISLRKLRNRGFCQFLLTHEVRGANRLFLMVGVSYMLPLPPCTIWESELVPLSDLGTLTCVSLVEHPHSECSTVLVKTFKCFFGTQTFQIQCFKFVGEGYPTCIF